jgi:Zn-dependent alcohol dehydrogenase
VKAAVCYELGAPLVVEDVELAAPGPGEVRVAVAAVAICHSDVHLVRGEWVNWSAPPPVVAGHEAAGLVEAVGDGVTGLVPGEPVVVTLLRSCGRCFFCTTGTPYLCEARFALAESDYDLKFSSLLGDFSCALDAEITDENAPYLSTLLRRSVSEFADNSLAV